jgi:hypothetical protein
LFDRTRWWPTFVSGRLRRLGKMVSSDPCKKITAAEQC